MLTRLFSLNRSIFVDILLILFGISSWISINGLWVELPLLVDVLPESWNLPSYLVFIVQVANAGPILYSILRWKHNISNSLCIFVVLIIGVIASFSLIFVWNKTVPLNGVSHSLGLFIPIFLLSMVDCTSSVLYFPYVGTFKSIYLNSYLMGEGLSGFLPSIVALLQGVGKTRCEKHWNATSQEWDVVVIKEPPNFSVEAFFMFLFGMMLVSLSAFVALHISPWTRSAKNDEPENASLVQTSEPVSDHGSITQSLPSESISILYSSKEIWFLLCAQGFINFFSNGVLPSIQTYSCLPYGKDIFHFVATTGPIIGPTVAFIGHFLSFKSLKIVVGFISFGTIIMGLIGATAILSPSTVFDPSIAGPVVVALWILNHICFSYSKNEIAGICGQFKNSDYLFWYGVLTQIGSALGALVSFLLINVFQLLTAAKPSEC